MSERVAQGTVAATFVVLAVLASFTHPFTWAADLVVSAGFVAVLAVVVVQRTWSTAPAVLVRRGLPGPATWGRKWALWLVPVTATVGWELFCYASSPRSAHPTLSSLLDSLDAGGPGHGVAFVLWLAFGWYLVTR